MSQRYYQFYTDKTTIKGTSIQTYIICDFNEDSAILFI